MSTWTTVGDLATARDGYGLIKLANGKALVIGGASPFPTMTKTCEIYDPNAQTWSATGSLNTEKGEGVYLTLNSGLIMAIGGYQSGSPNPTLSTICELYDPNAGTWSVTGSLAHGRSDTFGFWLLSDHTVLVAGGLITSLSANKTSEIYDPVAGTWSAGPDIWTNLGYPAACTLGDGRPFFCGGYDYAGNTNTARAYTYESGAWVRQPDMPGAFNFGNCKGAITLSDGRAFIMGGTANGSKMSAAYIFDHNTNTWSTTSTSNSTLFNCTLALLADHRVLVYAGFDSFPEGSNNTTTVTYDPSTNSWQNQPALNVGEAGQTYANNGVLFADNTVLSVGGQSSSGVPSKTTQIFSPTAAPAGGGNGVISLVQSVAGARVVGTSTATTITATGAGNLIVVLVGVTSGTVSSVTDNKGGGSSTYTLATNTAGVQGATNCFIYYTENCAAGITSVTANTGAGTVISATIYEFSGVATSNSLDQSNHTNSAGAAPTSPSLTTTKANEVLIGMIMPQSSNITGVTAPFTFVNNPNYAYGTSYQIVSSAGTYQAAYTPTGSQGFTSNLATFSAPTVFSGSGSDIKSQWFAAQGYASNTLNDQISRYLAANGGGISNDLNTQWYTFLSAKGRTGSVTDMYRAELIASLGLTSGTSLSITDLERMFYGGAGNTFA